LSKQKLRESQENFRLLADNISQLAWITDEKGSINWYNRRWYDYTGLEYESLKGSGWEKVQHPDYVEKVKQKFTDSINKGETWEDVFPLKSADGEYRWFLSSATPMRSQDGKIVKWFGTNTDITDQRNLILPAIS
jgi:PAS domain S-box-containing protein